MKIGKKKYDLSNLEQATEMQRLYELAMGTVGKIETQLVASAFFVDEQNKMNCVTYNRGDCLALRHAKETTEALSLPVLPKTSNKTTTKMNPGEKVLQMCDGVHEVIMRKELQDFNNHENVNQLPPLKYVEKFMQESIITGSHDDKLIVCVQVVGKKEEQP